MPVPAVVVPASFVFIPVLEDLDAEPVLFVVFPRADVLCACSPLPALEAAIFEFGLLLYPVDGRVRAIFVRFSIIAILFS